MKKLIVFFIFFISNPAFADELLCEMNLKNVNVVNGNLEISLRIPHNDFSVNLFYQNFDQRSWAIKNIEWSDDLVKNLVKQGEREKRGLRKLLKKNNNISLREIEELFNLKLNFIKYTMGDYTLGINDVMILINEFNKKERDALITEILEDDYFDYEDIVNQYDKEIKENLKDVDVLVSFDTYKKQGNSISMSTITDSGIIILSEIPSSSNNQNKKSTIEVSGLAGDTNFTIFLEGYCYDSYGIKVDNQSDSIESKLKKLKSLFDQDLITQDEYDEKRKEILDAM